MLQKYSISRRNSMVFRVSDRGIVGAPCEMLNLVQHYEQERLPKARPLAGTPN
ncbi:MAG: hypothetical protein AAF617_14570 [Bacteroidota bacterium]